MSTPKDQYIKKGMRVRLIDMPDDPDPIPSGTEGTVTSVQDLGREGQIVGVKWDTGRTLNMIPGVDEYEVIDYEETDRIFDMLRNESKEAKVSVPKSKQSDSSKNYSKNFKKSVGKHFKKLKVESDDDIKKPMPIKDIAKKHGVSVKDIEKEIKKGTKIEFEHIKNQNQKEDRELAKTIATHHVEEYHDYYTNPEHGLIANEKELEEDYAGAYVGPLGGSPIKRNVYEGKISGRYDIGDKFKVNTDDLKLFDDSKRGDVFELIDGGKNTLINHNGHYHHFKNIDLIVAEKTGKIKRITNETVTIKMADLLEVNTIDTKLRDGGSFDGNAWVGDKNNDGWNFNDKPSFHEEGEIVDILAKLDIDWKDEDLRVLTKENIMENISEVAGKEVHTEKWKSCFEKVKKQGKSEESAAAICTDSIGYKGSIKKKHRQQEELTESQLLDEGIKDKIIDKFNNSKEFVKNQKDSITKLSKYKSATENSFKNGKISKEEYENRKKQLNKYSKTLVKNMVKIVGPGTVPGGFYVRALISFLSKTDVGKNMGIDNLEKALTPETLNIRIGDDEESLEETTTFGSVWGVNGPPVGKTFASKGKTSSSGKSPIYSGGKIVQSVPNEGVLMPESIKKWVKSNITDRGNTPTEKQKQQIKDLRKKQDEFNKQPKSKYFKDYKGDSNSEEKENTNEVNKVKYNKDGKYVKLKNKCVKYRNQPFCSSGNADNPLILSDTTSDNIDEVSRKTGIPKEQIFEALMRR